jgi:hypothetical protein
MSKKLLSKLRHYAAYNINRLAKQDALLEPIDVLVQKHVAVQNNNTELMTDEEADKLINWSPDDNVGTPLSDAEVQHYHAIGKKLLEIATNPNSNNEHMLLIAKYLRPLFSQDHRTIDMGWDLEEYMDWYFLDTSQEERERYAKELMNGWYVH